ncbi:hypothetical protein H8L32_06550 [Undibacterium sp. CY18W]|uniref:YcxB-like protein n=1 Tax=Undibacterium hunanense TaxID=2762292 RepID=A0ABR6ZNG2_9BURK|nr:hypothetical protein [Undibacterium hunanense]MBC3917129.1 hypothetical protein [Undibacterium hunanense]
MKSPNYTDREIKSGSTERLELYRRRWGAYFSLPFGIAMCIEGIWALIFCITVFRGLAGIVIGIFALVLSLAFGISLIQGAVKTFKARGPALVFDEAGITHMNDGEEFIPWEAIEYISSNEGEGNDLGIWFKSKNTSKNTSGNDKPASGSFINKLKRSLIGADKTIQLGGIVYNPQALAKTIAKLHQQSRES